MGGKSRARGARLINVTTPLHLSPSSFGPGASWQGKVPFQGSFNSQNATYTAAGVGPIVGSYSGSDFFGVDPGRYAMKGIVTFIFDVDAQGIATAVMNDALQLHMRKRVN